MESVFAEAVCFGDFWVDRVCSDIVRHGVVEGGVKESDAGDAGELFSAEADDF